MSRAVQIQLPTGDVVWARLESVGGGASDVSGGGLFKLDPEEFRSTVRGVTQSLREAIDDLVPDQVQIEFGLELAVKSGKITSMLAEGSAKGTVKVSMTWTNGSAAAVVTGPPTAGDED